MAVTRNCVCCGRQYDFCPNCSKTSEPAWKVSFCSETCKELFNIVSAYNMNRIDKAAVNAFIAGHGITKITKYTEPIQKVLMEISSPETEVPVIRNETYYNRRRKRRRR